MPGYEAWRFHGKDSDVSGPCRRRLCLPCQACRLADWMWQLNRKLDRQHAERLGQAAATHRAVTAAITDWDTRTQQLLDDIKTPARRRRLWPR